MALNGLGNKNQTLSTGRTAYGKASDGNFYPVTVDTNGNVTIGSSTATISKTIQTELLAASAIAAGSVVASSVLSLTGVRQATFFIDHGLTSTVAYGALGGVNYWVQASEKASGNDTWRTLASFLSATAVATTALSSGAVAAGTTVITILSGTGMAVGDNVMWANTAAPATSTEWAKVVAISGTASFTILDGITNAQGSTVVITNKAEHFVVTVDTGSLTRARVVVNNTNGTTDIVRSRIAAITEV